MPTTSTTDTKNVQLVFVTKELEYDIANAMWLEGDVTHAEDPHDRHQIQDILEGGNADIVNRALDKAHAAVLSLLIPFTKEEIEDGTTLDDVLRRKVQYEVNLELPSNFPRSALLTLNTAIHNYLVDRVLFDWAGRMNLDSRSIYAEKIIEDEATIEDAKNRRTSTTRIHLHPFP